MANFRAKARAVELLGKGQIADLPTAITELWKNGYDAYAKTLECKLFLDSYKDNKSPVFVLSDDGFGMSETDILNKWFVLGTDSKARNEKLNPKFGLKRRTPMGEKGIGRLSVSYLGPQMLMLSKKKGVEATAFLMDWRVLDNYDFFLEDLEIPLFTFDTREGFKDSFEDSKQSFAKNLDKKKWGEQIDYRNTISKEWDGLFTPGFIYEEIIENFCRKDFHGTYFVIFSPHDQLLELTDKDRVDLLNDNSLKYLRNSLSGLHNDLKNIQKDFEANFYIFDAVGRYNLIDDFFTEDEMLRADHWMKGEFDENGFFSGEIKVFNKREKYTFRPNRPPGKTAYGPFSIQWGSFEGERRNTNLTDQEYAIINNKLGNFGGLYIYRDDFRVLPYGRTESDFLEFEKRRTLSAGTYFFSHRRFIGYIDLARDRNGSLRDKAGREGFIQNRAYREFRDDLMDFFIDIAKTYMKSSKDKKFDTFRENQIFDIQAKHEKQEAAVKRKNSKTKKAFLANLSDNSLLIDALKDDIESLETKFNEEVNQIEINYNNYNNLLEQLEQKKTELREIKVQKPQTVKITKRKEEDYKEYQSKYYAADAKLRDCIAIVDKTRERINLENLKLEFNEKFRGHVRLIKRQFDSFENIAKDTFIRLGSLLKEEKIIQVDSFINDTENLKLTDVDTNSDISRKILNLEAIINGQKQKIEETFEGFIKHITNLQIDVDDDFLRGWFQVQNENLEKKLKDYEELAQLGMAIEIIDHQFNVMYSQMNDAVSEIGKYARNNKEIEYSFKQLKGAFQHLEGNYKLLKPLYRTSRRTREVISGHQIEQYLKEFFKNEFKRYKIDFSVNNDFREYEFFSYDSIIKPVFLNLVNNANYWLIPVEDRKIRIELIDGEIRVMNSGERIDDSQLDQVFTLFYTRKRDGRGIGLYLAQNNLSAIGYDIHATNDNEKNTLNGACFVMKEREKV